MSQEPQAASEAENAVPLTARDYVSEMRAVINAETSSGPYISGVVAEHIVTKLRATDPDLLVGWLDAQAESFVRMAINDRDRSRRSHARTAESRSAFAEDARRFAAQQSERGSLANKPQMMQRWLHVPYPVAGGVRKQLAELDAKDLQFVAEDYDRRAAENAFEAAFFRALAKKVTSGTVADHFTDDQLIAMRSSITGLKAA